MQVPAYCDQHVETRSAIISTFDIVVVLVLAELVSQRTSFNASSLLDDSLLGLDEMSEVRCIVLKRRVSTLSLAGNLPFHYTLYGWHTEVLSKKYL